MDTEKSYKIKRMKALTVPLRVRLIMDHVRESKLTTREIEALAKEVESMRKK